MSELSDNAQSLAETLCGSECRHHNGTLSRWEGMGELGEVETIRYDKQKLLDVAAAALELAGEKVEWFDRSNRHSRTRYYRLADEEAVVVVEQVYQVKPNVQVYRSRDLAGQNLAAFAAILLHAAATVRAWEGEKL
jgi:hypothetical protein